MNNNVFMYSDASYCNLTNIASVSVLCSSNGKIYNKILKNMDNVFIAETTALLYSIKIAIKNGYDNVVFIYDNININIEIIKNLYEKNFKYIQFLWLKRENIQQVDIHARKHLRIKRDVHITNLIDSFLSYPTNIRLKAIVSMFTKNQNEYEILKTFISGKYDLTTLNEIKVKKTINLRYVYHILDPKERIKFYDYIIKVVPKIKNVQQFKNAPKNVEIAKFIEQVVSKNKDKKNKK